MGQRSGQWHSEEGRTVNAYLKQVEAQIFQHYREMLANHTPVTAEGLRKAYLGVQDQEPSLMNLIEYHNTELKHTIEWGTLKNYFTTQAYVKQFPEKRFNASDKFFVCMRSASHSNDREFHRHPFLKE